MMNSKLLLSGAKSNSVTLRVFFHQAAAGAPVETTQGLEHLITPSTALVIGGKSYGTLKYLTQVANFSNNPSTFYVAIGVNYSKDVTMRLDFYDQQLKSDAFLIAPLKVSSHDPELVTAWVYRPTMLGIPGGIGENAVPLDVTFSVVSEP